MRIIAGKLKGKKLAACRTDSIRPAMALVRKSIFDTLQNFIQDTNILDLCAGSGSLGIEALSRNAKKLTLIDSDRESIRLIKKNLKLCNVSAKVVHGQLPKVLNKLKDENFDLIFLDPPYGKSSFIEETLEKLYTYKMLTKEGLIVIESELKSSYKVPEGLTIYKEKKFGNTKVTMFKL
ncbi:MAG: 16S rRNA (guanine(966)-N(2))-methyltransferase RsmD [Candidatus Melainabacteria bacterium RIFCSPLOWO2_02_FULL_35_15]|nr:MAG: 16S rRNA (guanine(966)-N(2))-methyltransferase RsmD [Candidatus Melainabacteria bacterium RIFCSPLOWO2_12_FULL_35_11]OGI13374.1 MAG: 16S rRNA (guanine(966)-N(2))-methyltransferase RsmD [Candidatus Melainabacteria bacterium RIFCSPLOWO2_02_FULL_35_15]